MRESFLQHFHSYAESETHIVDFRHDKPSFEGELHKCGARLLVFRNCVYPNKTVSKADDAQNKLRQQSLYLMRYHTRFQVVVWQSRASTDCQKLMRVLQFLLRSGTSPEQTNVLASFYWSLKASTTPFQESICAQ